MEEFNKDNLDALNVPDTITDPDERAYFEHLHSAIKIAAKKNLPFMILTAYDDIGKAFLSAQGCKICISKLIKELIDREPDMLNVIMGGVATHLIGKDSQDKASIEYAKKNTPTGN